MGSYEGSSDWDDLPQSASFASFKPQPMDGRTEPAAPRPQSGAEAGEPQLELEGRAPAVRHRLNALFALDTTGSMTRG